MNRDEGALPSEYNGLIRKIRRKSKGPEEKYMFPWSRFLLFSLIPKGINSFLFPWMCFSFVYFIQLFFLMYSL